METKNLTYIRAKKEKFFNLELNNFLLEVKKEMSLCRILYKKAKFSCFSDGIFTYSYSSHITNWEFNIICTDVLLDKMTIKELLELKNIKYFENGIYCKQTLEKLGGVSFNY